MAKKKLSDSELILKKISILANNKFAEKFNVASTATCQSIVDELT